MKKIINGINKFLNENTSGFPLLLWSVGGMSVAVFLFVFRNRPNVRFDILIYVMAISAIWIVLSDVAKKKEILNRRAHFIIDSIFYISAYGSIVYLTNGFEGDLYFLFFLATVSAPLFGTLVEMLVFLVFLSATSLSLFLLTDISKRDVYHLGVILLQIVFYFIIAGVNKYFLEKINKDEREKIRITEEMVVRCEEQVKMKTQNLEDTKKKLQENNAALEDTRRAVLNMLEDVSQSEQESRKKSIELEKFKQSVEVGYDHVIITDADGIILYANHAVEEITGYSPAEAVGKTSGELWGGHMTPEFYEKMWQTIKRNKEPFSGEVLNKRKDGKEYLASIRISPILNEQGEVKFFAGVERDITEERRAQERITRHAKELQRANVEIEEQKERTESILGFLRSIGDGVVATDLEGKIIFFNEAIEHITGIKSADALGKDTFQILKFFREKDQDEQYKVVAAAKENRLESEKIENRFVLRNSEGRQMPVSFTVSKIFNSRNKEQGFIMVIRDVTEERELEKTKDNFLSVAAHQLRTPLSGIRWNLEMLLEGDAGKLTKEAKEIIGNINENNQRLVTLVNDLLNVSRINQGKVTEPARPTGICETVSAVLKSSAGFADKNKIKIIFDEEKNKDIKAMISPQRLFESVENVVSNAIKYTPESGKVKIFVTKDGGEVKITIADNGIGIPKKEQEKMFSKFFRAENAVHKDPEGSGLGMSVVKSFIEEAKGRVTFESAEGEGTTFYINLPIYKEK